MHESFRAFAERLIDYAGMFPPADLPLSEALENYLRYREGPDEWMLGRFICPAQRLSEIGTPVRISALGRGGPPGSFEAGIREDLDEIARFRNRIGSFGWVAVLENRLPDGAEPVSAPGLRVFYEAQTMDAVEGTIEAIERYTSAGEGSMEPAAGLPSAAGDSPTRTSGAGDSNGSGSGSAERVAGSIGLKIRCGGVTPDAFPSSERIAFAIASCRRAGVPFKATAGLHHPVRAFRTEVGTKMHGFLNVFGAALLAHAHRLDEDRLLPILDEEDAGAFRFTDADFSWRDLRIESERIRSLRRIAVTSFGSCSFDEPRADLRGLGLLGQM